MELESGFKLSEAGPIPEDWEAVRLGDVCSVILDGPHYTPKFVEDGVPFYAGENIVQNDYDGAFRISYQEYLELSRRLSPRRYDLLLVRVGEIGHTALVTWTDQFHVYVNVAVLRAGKRLSPGYLSSASQSKQFQRSLMDRALLQAVPKKINLKSISEIYLPLPSSTEQDAIAGTVDDLDLMLKSSLAEMNKLIAARSAIIDALLAHSVRLPGYSADWNRCKLGDICVIKKGQQLGRAYLDKAVGYPVWNGGVAPSGFSEAYNSDGPACIISEGGNSCGSVTWVETNFWCGGHCYVIRPLSTKHIPHLIYYAAKFAEEKIKALRVGSGLPNVQIERLAEFEIFLPGDVAEQHAIVTVLSAIDAALAAARAVVAKARSVKAAAMDALLSGRVRLPGFGPAARRAPADALEAA